MQTKDVRPIPPGVARTSGDDITMRRLVSRISGHQAPTIYVIQKMTADEFGLSLSQLLGRDRELTKARYFGMALCLHFLAGQRSNGSVAYVARKFGRDRWSVLKAQDRYGDTIHAAARDSSP